MKLHEVMTTATNIIGAVTELAAVPVFSDGMKKADLEEALQANGLALVLIQESGEPPSASVPDLLLSNMLIVSVVENPKTNTFGLSALEVAGLVLKAIHQYDWPNRGIKNGLKVDNPAYTRGELDSGLVTYFCNFLIKTIQ